MTTRKWATSAETIITRGQTAASHDGELLSAIKAEWEAGQRADATAACGRAPGAGGQEEHRLGAGLRRVLPA